MTPHLSDAQLYSMMEQEDALPEIRQLMIHLKTCPECRQKLQSMRAFEQAVRRSMREHAPSNLASNVLRELSISEEPSIAWRVMQYAAPVIALVMIVGIVAGVFYFTGAFRQQEIQAPVAMGQSAYDQGGKILSDGVGAFNAWVKQNISFPAGAQGGWLAIFLALFFAAIALLDKYLFNPMFRRKMRTEN